MRTPKGFGKNYFTLSAIQAYSSGIRLDAIAAVARTHTRFYGTSADDDFEAPPEEEIAAALLTELPEPSSPRHCNCFYRRRTRTVERRVRAARRLVCRCRKTKTGISPPLFPIFPTLRNHTDIQGIL